MRRTATQVIRTLENRVAQLEKEAFFNFFEEAEDTKREQVVKSIPSASRIDISPRKHNFKDLCIQLANGLSRSGNNALYKKMRRGEVEVHLFKLLAQYTDGGSKFVLYEVYYTRPNTGELVKT